MKITPRRQRVNTACRPAGTHILLSFGAVSRVPCPPTNHACGSARCRITARSEGKRPAIRISMKNVACSVR
jgi:hypothetical protein